MSMGKHFVVYIPCCIQYPNPIQNSARTKCCFDHRMHIALNMIKKTSLIQNMLGLMSFPKVLLTFCSDLNLKGCMFIFSHAQASQTVLSVFCIDFRFSSQLVFFFFDAFCFTCFSSGPHNSACRPQLPKESNSRNESRSNHFVTK